MAAAGIAEMEDLEIREAQREYLDFLDDEVMHGTGRHVLLLPGTGGRTCTSLGAHLL